MENNETWNVVSKSFDDYIENIVDPNFQIETDFNLSVNDDGMIPVTNSLDLKKHAIVLGNSLVFPHSFLRRHGHDNFADINVFLKQLSEKGNDVLIRLDPFKIANKNNYQELLEKEHLYGPKFSNELLKRDKNPSSSVFWSNLEEKAEVEQYLQLINYPVKYTIFRPSWLDEKNHIIQYYIEELMLPYNYESKKFPPYSSSKYVAQKFVHFTFDRVNDYFEHIDGAVRVFDRNGYENLYNNFENSFSIYPQHIDGVKRYKLFKVKGKLSLKDTSNILKEYLMYNPHINEYFDGAHFPSLYKNEKLDF